MMIVLLPHAVENMTDVTGNEINSCGMYTLLNHNYQGHGYVLHTRFLNCRE